MLQWVSECWLSMLCPQIGSHIKNRVQELGHGCAALVTKAGALQCSPSDAYTKKELIECARRVSEKVPARMEKDMVQLWPRTRMVISFVGTSLLHSGLQ